MAARTRRATIAVLAAFVVAGILAAVFVSGATGEVLTVVLIAIGLTGGLFLAFLEIGFGEGRDLALEEKHKRAEADRQARASRRLPRRPRRPG